MIGRQHASELKITCPCKRERAAEGRKNREATSSYSPLSKLDMFKWVLACWHVSPVVRPASALSSLEDGPCVRPVGQVAASLHRVGDYTQYYSSNAITLMKRRIPHMREGGCVRHGYGRRMRLLLASAPGLQPVGIQLVAFVLAGLVHLVAPAIHNSRPGLILLRERLVRVLHPSPKGHMLG